MIITSIARPTLTRSLLIILASSIALALSAQLSIPLLPVPVTLQTMLLLVLAVFLGPQLTFFAAVAYLVEGAMGLPVFADFSGGLPILLGVTGGYLLALPFAGFIAGWVTQKRTFSRALVAGVISTLIILTSGTLFLSHFLGLHLAFAFGFKPFIAIEMIKVLAVAIGVILSNRLQKKSN